MRIRNPNSDLRGDQSFSAFGQWVVEALRHDLGVSAVNVCPLFSGSDPKRESVGYSLDHSVEEMRSLNYERFHLADETFGPVTRLPPQTLDSFQLVPLEQLQRTEFYNEFLRRFQIERQLLAVLGTPEAPLGFICAARRLSDRPFRRGDIESLEAIRRSAQPWLAQIARDRSHDNALDAVMLALESALPRPCGVLDAHARFLWVNQAAERALNLQLSRTGDGRLVTRSIPKLRDWQEAVVAAAAAGMPAVLSRSDGTCVRRVDRGAQPPLFVVSSSLQGVEHLKHLTQREREVVELVINGYSTLNAAVLLGVTEGTLRNHMKRIYRKLGVRTRIELACTVRNA